MLASITAAYLARYRSVAGDRADLLPLTGAQRRFLLARRLDPHGRPDVVPLFFVFPTKAVDPALLRAAATALAARHPALRANLTAVRGTPVLRLGAPAVEVAEVALAPGESTDDALRRALLDWPADGPALRLLLAAGPAPDEQVLAIALDHAACDEQSLGIVTAGLSELYGQRPDQPAADAGVTSHREAVQAQLATEAAASSDAAFAHWARRLGNLADSDSGADADPDAAEARPAQAPATGMVSHRLPAATGAARGAVFPALLDAASAAAVSLFGADRALALGYPWGGRPPGAPQVLGCFLNTLVHPATAGPGELEAIGADWWDDLDHADTPFDEVVHAARSAGARWSGALDGALTFEDLHRRPPLVLGGTAGRERHLAGRPLPAPFAVSASHGEDLLVRFAWDRHRCTDDAADAAVDALLRTLRGHFACAADATVSAGAS